MLNMRKRITVVCGGMLALLGIGQSFAKVLVVTPQKTGEPTQKIDLTVGTKMTFSEKTFEIVSTQGENLRTFSFSDVRHLTFEDGTAGGGNDTTDNRMYVRAGQLQLAYNPVGDILRVNGHDGSRTTVQIFNVTGKKIYSSAWQGEDLYVGNLTSGLYVITIQSQTIKFIKK